MKDNWHSLEQLSDTNAILYRKSVTVKSRRLQQSFFRVFGHSTKRLKNKWDAQQILGPARFGIFGDLDVFCIILSGVQLCFCCVIDVLDLEWTRNSDIEASSFSFRPVTHEDVGWLFLSTISKNVRRFEYRWKSGSFLIKTAFFTNSQEINIGNKKLNIQTPR